MSKSFNNFESKSKKSRKREALYLAALIIIGLLILSAFNPDFFTRLLTDPQFLYFWIIITILFIILA
ncbi:MAG: hypothetical protein ACP6IS_02165, partial [Candidatus Asgardarchaeia archaeon]